MKSYLNIPVTFSFSKKKKLFEEVPVEQSIKQFIDLLIETRQGECFYNKDFGYEIWSNEFEPNLNPMEWQPKLMEQIKFMLEKYEPRITQIRMGEPQINKKIKEFKTDKDYKITLTLDYRTVQTGEWQRGIKISFEY
jgi:phage baseplate assembly protein W